MVLKVGGSILFDSKGLRIGVLRNLARHIIRIASVEPIVVVIGGGLPARQYINWAYELGLSNADLDILGINISRNNAFLFLRFVSNLAKYKIRIAQEIPTNPLDVRKLLSVHDVVFCGGFIPGQSTVGVSAEVAEIIGADLLLIATDVDGIYDRDPRKFSDANKLNWLSYEKVIGMFLNSEETPGTYRLFDLQSLKILSRSKITTVVFKGDEQNISEILNYALKRDVENLAKYASIIGAFS